MKLNTRKTFNLMLLLICGLWLLHVSALAIVEKRLPQTLNPNAPEYYSIWKTVKHFFKLLSPPTLLCLTYFLDRKPKFQKHENTVNQLFLSFICVSSFLVIISTIVSPVTFVAFFTNSPYSSARLFIAFFAQIVWLWLAGLSYLIFRKRFNSHQSVFLAVLTVLSAELIWEFPINIKHGLFATFPITDFTMYLARFIPLYLLLAYGLIHKIGNHHYFPFIWIPGVVSFFILLFISFRDYPSFWNKHYFRAVWCICFLAYAILLTKGKK